MKCSQNSVPTLAFYVIFVMIVQFYARVHIIFFHDYHADISDNILHM